MNQQLLRCYEDDQSEDMKIFKRNEIIQIEHDNELYLDDYVTRSDSDE